MVRPFSEGLFFGEIGWLGRGVETVESGGIQGFTLWGWILALDLGMSYLYMYYYLLPPLFDLIYYTAYQAGVIPCVQCYV